MSTASKGASFEREIRHLFESAGYSVIRGAGSKGLMLAEKVDLVATKVTDQNEYRAMLTIIGIQCKAHKRRANKFR